METCTQQSMGTANVDTTLTRKLVEEMTRSSAELYTGEALDAHDHLAAKSAFLPPIFAEAEILVPEAWYDENACRLGTPFAGVELEITLKASEEEDKRYTARCLVEMEVDFCDCSEYLEDLILQRTYETSVKQAADFFKLPVSTIKGLVLMSHQPIHAFPIGQFLSRPLQVNLFETFLSQLNLPITPSDEHPTIEDLPEDMRPYMNEQGLMIYPSAFKTMVLHKLLDEGVKVSELSKLYDLNTSLVGNWRRAHRNNRPMETSKSLSGHCTKSIMQAYQQLIGSGRI